MTSWEDILQSVIDAANSLGRLKGRRIFYRGQSDANWDLRPSLARRARQISDLNFVRDTTGPSLPKLQEAENHFYYQLFSRGGHLLPKTPGAWEILFLMRHHGFPTRLLDWTTSFAIALFFALQADVQRQTEAAAIWVLSPAQLNYETRRDTGICVLNTDYPVGYERYFAYYGNPEYGTFPHPIVAAWADSSNERIRAQRGAFTLHGDLRVELEGFTSSVRKITIPAEVFPRAQEFLYLAGIDAAWLFPDLDSLATLLVKNTFGT